MCVCVCVCVCVRMSVCVCERERGGWHHPQACDLSEPSSQHPSPGSERCCPALLPRCVQLYHPLCFYCVSTDSLSLSVLQSGKQTWLVSALFFFFYFYSSVCACACVCERDVYAKRDLMQKSTIISVSPSSSRVVMFVRLLLVCTVAPRCTTKHLMTAL